MFRFSLNPLMHPEEVIDKGTAGVESMIKFMDEDEKEEVIDIKEKKDSKDDKKKDEEKDDKDEKDENEDDELKDIEDELEEPDAEKLELSTDRPRKKDILKDFPEIFKKYPGLENAYYREQQFTEVLGTIEDAKEAVAKADTLDKFEADLSKGDLLTALKATKEIGEESFNKLVDNYLPNLMKVDKDAYHHVVGNIIRMGVIDAINTANSSKNDDLKAAAEIFYHYIFGTNQITKPSELSRVPEKNGREEELNRREQQLMRERFEESRDGLNTKISNVLKSTIEGNIDPKESMTDYVRKNASREALENLESLLESDRRLITLIDRLWEDSAKKDFSKASIDVIKSAYLSRAKTLLPTVIKKARNEALKGIGKRVKEDDDEEAGQKKGPIPAGRTHSSSASSGKNDKEKAAAIPKGMSYRDYLNAD